MSVSVSVQRLRVWLLVGAGLLVLVTAVFIGYARYRTHRFLTKLPAKLGIDVQQEANGYTLSKTTGGITIYTIHAAKERQYKAGKISLYDVGIVVYGKKQDRADRIYGKEFELDQASGVIQAKGEVFIDLQAPAPPDSKAKSDYAAGKDLHGAPPSAAGSNGNNERLVHIKTSGLVYLQKLGVAATDKDIEFTSGGLTGHAVGADYNSDTGVVVLHSAVRVNGLQHERPIVLTASQAILDRQAQTTVLTQAKYVVVGGGAGQSGETAQAQHVVVHMRKDGTAERLDADGNVILTNGEGGTVAAPKGEMKISAENHPQSAVLSGGVKYGEDSPLRQAQGESADAQAAFDKAGRIEHLTMNGAVHMHERARTTDAAAEPWSERELNASNAELALVSDSTGKTSLRDAKATGNARLTVINPSVKGGKPTSSALAGDVLTAHFARLNGADHVTEVHGDGHTSVRRVNAKGVVNTSSGDTLVAKFRPAKNAAQSSRPNAPGQSGGDEISSAVEQGHVVMTQLPEPKPTDTAPPQLERATAERAVYDGDLEKTTLTGNVEVSDGTSTLWADRVVSEQQTGDSTADGSVKVSYRQAGSADEPTHVIASRGEFKHDSQVAIFHGVPGKPARLWQAASQVEAPVIQFEQKERRLQAHGDGQGAPTAVHTVLVSSGSPTKNSSTPNKAGASSGKTDVVRIVSRDLVYSDELRRADFTGGVQVQSADGIMHGQQAVVYLKPAAPGKADGGKESAAQPRSTPVAVQNGFMGGSVDRVVATGHIDMEQPGRRATGEQVVYTANDGMFVLTGTPAVPPKVIDEQRGTVTGASLRFHSGDENVVVSNGEGAGQRVHTETRVKNK